MTTQIAEQAGKSFDLVRNPSLWPGTATNQLVENLVTLSLYLGVYHTEGLFEEFRPFYWYVAERTTVEQRLEVFADLAGLVERFEAGLATLLPFLCADEELAIISTAALNLSFLIPPRSGDLLTGPKDVLGFIETADTDNSRVGILQGSCSLGIDASYRCWTDAGRSLEGKGAGVLHIPGLGSCTPRRSISFSVGWRRRTTIGTTAPSELRWLRTRFAKKGFRLC